MSVTVGTVTFDGATGTPTPPLTETQLSSYAAGVKAYRYNGSPPTGEGQLDAWSDLGEAAAQAKLRDAGGLIGRVVVVAYPHGNIVGVAVASVTGEWQARAGTVNGGVLLVRFVFDRSADKDSGDEERTIVDVQTAPALAGPWTTEAGWAAFAGSDGLGTYAGESSAAVSNIGPDKSKLGKWVRVVNKGSGGAPSSAIRWVGVIVGVGSSARRDPTQGIGWGARTTYRFAGLAHVLAQLHTTQWYEAGNSSSDSPVSFQGTTPTSPAHADVGNPIVFNTEGKPNRDPTATIQIDAPPAPKVRLHARGYGDTAAPWTAFEATRTCIAHVRKSWPVLPPITLAGTDEDLAALLGYSATWDVTRAHLLGMLATILSPQHMRTFRLSVDWATSSIIVTPVDLSAAGTAFDLTGTDIADWQCDFDAATQADAWFLDAGEREYLTTVAFEWSTTTTGGVRAWSAAQETASDAATTPEERESLALAHVGRRFILDPVWNGNAYNGTTPIPYFRVTSGADETGELGPGSEFPPAHVAWKIRRTIPLGEGQDWAAAYPGPKLPVGSPAVGPLVFFWLPGSPMETVHTDYQVSVLDDVAGIELGRDSDDALAIKKKLKDDDYAILATLSFVHPFSWRVSKVGTAARTDAPRVGFTYLPSSAFNRVDALAKAIIGTDAAGAPKFATAGRRDGGGSLADLRDAFAVWYMTPDGSAEWRQRDASTMTPDPGTIVASIKATVDSGPPIVSATILVGAPIARRVQSWDLYNPGVTWSASRIAPNIGGDGGAAAVVAGRGIVGLNKPSDMDKGMRNA
jgi:hypothetical protein